MKQLLKLVPLALVLPLLAACGAVITPQQGLTEEAAQQAIVAELDAAFAASAAADGEALQPASSALSSQGLSTIVVHRTRMQRSHQLQTIEIDLTTTPPSATAVVALNVRGVAQLVETYPDTAAPHKLLGEKEIDLNGTATFSAEYRGGEWHLVGVEHTGLIQGDGAATISNWYVSPDPLEPGSDANVLTVMTSEPDTTDEFLVIGRGRHMRPKTVANDDGMDPDPVAGDDEYNGYLSVEADARPGRHLGFITVLNYTDTTDLTTDPSGAFVTPYTDFWLPVVVDVADTDGL